MLIVTLKYNYYETIITFGCGTIYHNYGDGAEE